MTTDVWNSSSAGKIIKIDQPEILNVQLLKNDKTLGEVIPFKRKASKKPMIAFIKHASPQTRKIFNETSLIPSVLVHDVEQGFCFTYNKLQGATIDRLIIVLYDLSNCKLGKLCLHKLYVALSRVRKGKHLAVFNVSKRELQYLKKLSYSDKLLAWDSNYNNEGRWKTDTTIFLMTLKDYLIKFIKKED